MGIFAIETFSSQNRPSHGKCLEGKSIDRIEPRLERAQKYLLLRMRSRYSFHSLLPNEEEYERKQKTSSQENK